MSDPLAGYANRTGRPSGPLLRALGAVAPGVASVRAQAEPYADAWTAHNQAVLSSTGLLDRRPRWVVLGDSLAQGVGATVFDRGLVGQLERRLAAAGHGLDVVNLSATGARVLDVLDQQVPLLAALTADLVTVVVGSNDLFGRPRHRRALPASMSRLARALPVGSVVATLPQPRRAAELADRELEASARSGHLRLVDLRTSGPSSWRGLVAADWFHPNDAGYAALADAFEPVLLAALDTTTGSASGVG
ncbi:SGNH/GDSL hydrolase family protein [Nocardioides acrostichi]|uniref:SGNH/GDSL hydrolase family protein n=1 Tax=Nocardioides acrostichi TaxID=2784339 RepID=A0A930UW78_9ACTN|nr:SGNH/GDSL hydrolase family protein [Nocardioides acrostichi]MBF4161998.1 SGNH/GDSL hydrolase family protein [Nocardioides acrostichi]